MNPFHRWMRGRHRTAPSATTPADSRDTQRTVALLEQARLLVRQGSLHEASRTYSRIPPKLRTTEVWLEHAEMLLDLGDTYGAAANATHVLQAEPTDARALAIRRRVLEQDARGGRQG